MWITELVIQNVKLCRCAAKSLFAKKVAHWFGAGVPRYKMTGAKSFAPLSVHL